MANGFYVYAFYEEGKRKPFYVGKGKGNRIDAHFEAAKLTRKSAKNSKIKSIWAAGKKVLTKKLHENLTEEQAIELEASYIEKFGRIDLATGCLTNHTDGGEGGITGYKFNLASCLSRQILSKGRVFSEEHKEKIRAALTGKKLSKEHKASLSRARRGVKRGPHTEETKKKMSEAKKGRIFSAAHKAALKAAQQARREREFDSKVSLCRT